MLRIIEFVDKFNNTKHVGVYQHKNIEFNEILVPESFNIGYAKDPFYSDKDVIYKGDNEIDIEFAAKNNLTCIVFYNTNPVNPISIQDGLIHCKNNNEDIETLKFIVSNSTCVELFMDKGIITQIHYKFLSIIPGDDEPFEESIFLIDDDYPNFNWLIKESY